MPDYPPLTDLSNYRQTSSMADLAKLATEPDFSQLNAPTGEARVHHMSVSEWLQAQLQKLLMGGGAEPYVAGHLAQGLTGLAGANPVTGVPMAAADLIHAKNQGDITGAAIAGLGMIPGAGPEARTTANELRAAAEPIVARAQQQAVAAGRPLEAIAPGDTRVSTRFPTAVKPTHDPLAHHLTIGADEMRLDPEAFNFNVGLVSRYPGFAHLAGADAQEAAKAYMQQAADNMQYLYERSPADIRLRSPRWYEGANEIADALANRWGIPRQSVSAATAVLSPKADWFTNLSMAERTGDIMMQNPRVTSEMMDWLRSTKLLSKPEFKDALGAIEGKRLDQITDPMHRALALRAYDEAHNPQVYRSVLPEGYFGDFVRNQNGSPAKMSWSFFNPIVKAMQAVESGGNMNVISPLLGNKHKVRSFYNNIEVPFDARYGDITGDTHQVAAAHMRPLSGEAEAVIHHLGSSGPKGSINPRSSDKTGVQGTYGLIADATRDFAARAGLLPRAAQSATWEPVRELFSAGWKNPTNAAAVDDIWKAYDRREISIEDARDRIFRLAGGIGTPEWARPGLKATAPTLGSSYR